MDSNHRAPRSFFAETREHWPIMSVYERFEQVVAIVLSLVIATVIALALVQLVIRVVLLLLSGAIDPLVITLAQQPGRASWSGIPDRSDS